MTTFRATAPLRLTIAGAEVAPLSALLDTGCVSVRLERRATVTLGPRAAEDAPRDHRSPDHRSIVRGLGRTLLVEPALEPVVDEGPLALEGWALRLLAPGEALSVTVDAPDAPDLASLEARAEAFAAALGALRGTKTSATAAAALAARAGSPLMGVPPAPPAMETAVSVSVSSLDGWRALAAHDTAWLDELVLFRDPHAPTEPSARLALLAWNEGKDRDELRDAARAARACARTLSRAPARTLASLVAREARAVSVLAPASTRESRVDERLRDAGAEAVRRLGERGLILAIAPRARHEAILAAGRDMNLEPQDVRPASCGATVQEIPA